MTDSLTFCVIGWKHVLPLILFTDFAFIIGVYEVEVVAVCLCVGGV